MSDQETGNRGAEPTAVTPEQLDRLLARLDSLEQTVRAQSERLAAQDAELGQLRAVAASVAAEAAAPTPTPLADQMLTLPEHVAAARASRRGMLTRAAAAFAGLGLAGVALQQATANPSPQANPPRPTATPAPPPPVLQSPVPAAPAGRSPTATNDPWLIGNPFMRPTNSSLTDVTQLTNPAPISGRATPHPTLLRIWNGPNTAGSPLPPPPSNADARKISIMGASSYTGTDVLTGEDHIALYGWAPGGTGLVADARWPIRVVSQSTVGDDTAPPLNDGSGNAAPDGTLYNRGAQNLWFQWGGGGVFWRRIASFSSVGVPIGISPVRVVDTRGAPFGPIGVDGSGNPISAGQVPDGATRTYRIAGQFGIPSDARAIIGNLTIVQGGPSGGFVTIYPGDVGTAPNASNINPSAAILANLFFVRLGAPGGAGAGNINVRSVGTNRDLVIDVTGYFY